MITLVTRTLHVHAAGATGVLPRAGRVLLLLLLAWSGTLLLPTLAGAQSSPPGITMTDLGTLGGAYSVAFGINEQDQVVGWSYTADGNSFEFRHAFLWQNGSVTDLGTLGGGYSMAYDINEQGQVVGSSMTANGETHAFLWQAGTMTDLGTLDGAESAAYGINDQGQVVGWSHTPDGFTHAFLWQNGSMTDLGDLGGGYSIAYGINNQGQVVGESTTTDEYESMSALLWQNGVMTDLGTTLGGDWSAATAINDQGQVVGYLSDDEYPFPFLWQNGSMTDLGPPGGTGMARGVNNQGQIVGWIDWIDPIDPGSKDYDGAVLWQNGSMTDLGGIGSYAYDINEQGQVVGESGGRAVMWTLPQPLQSPTEQIRALRAMVGDLVQARVLNKGQGQALMTKLNGALEKLDRDQPRVAANKLHAFVNQVEAFQRNGKLTAAQAQPLIDSATHVTADLGG